MIRVEVPATSANCSIGFDCLGLALDWRSIITFEEADRRIITGCPEEYAGEDNLVWQAFVDTCRAAGVEPGGVHIDIQSDIPFARGLGSSSQCVAAGILGANELYGLGLDESALLAIGCEIEGHPDNIAPALQGGLCACVKEDDGVYQTILPAGGWKALAVIPRYPISTPEARKLLPESLPLYKAARQAGHAILFSHAWDNQDEDLLFAACRDELHEPARSQLIAEYDALRAISQDLRLPFWISGSGSTMLYVSLDENRLSQAAAAIEAAGLPVDLRFCAASDQGAQACHG